MFKHRYTRVLALVLLILLVAIDYYKYMPWYFYLILLFSFLSVTFLGSYFIRLNYFTTSLCHGSRDKKEIAITFDDGPLKEFTPALLDLLKAEKIPAVFFLIGKNIPGNEHLVKRMVGEGHIIGNHSFEHGQWFSLQSKSKMNDDVRKCSEEIERVTGLKVNLFRPPYGVTNPTVAKVIEQNNFKSIGWSLRTYDTVAKSSGQLLEKTLKSLKSGDVILFHDWGKHTMEILPTFINETQKRGLKIVRIDKLLRVNPYN